MRILDTDHCVAVLRGRLDVQGQIAPDERDIDDQALDWSLVTI